MEMCLGTRVTVEGLLAIVILLYLLPLSAEVGKAVPSTEVFRSVFTYRNVTSRVMIRERKAGVTAVFVRPCSQRGLSSGSAGLSPTGTSVLGNGD